MDAIDRDSEARVFLFRPPSRRTGLVGQVSASFAAAANDQLDRLAAIFQKVLRIWYRLDRVMLRANVLCSWSASKRRMAYKRCRWQGVGLVPAFVIVPSILKD